MSRGLIGYTGFVGSNLNEQYEFDTFYNSKNFAKMAGRNFAELVCAGVAAEKWKANKNPTEDLERIQRLIKVLKNVKADRFVLISTIDVYPIAHGKDESFDCHKDENHAYGKNRLLFEDFCVEHFPKCHVIRLPGLFGKGIKKNIIYDLLHGNMLEKINPSSSFQYYYLKNLWSDIEIAINADLPLLNLFTEPIATIEIWNRFFSDKHIGSLANHMLHYDLHTCYSHIFCGNGSYRHSKEEVLLQMQEFIASEVSRI